MPIIILGAEDDSQQPLTPEKRDDVQVAKRERKKFKRDSNILFWANVIAGVVHLISFAAALTLSIVFRDRIYRATVTSSFLKDEPSLRKLFTYTLSWSILPFPIITSLFHLTIASPLLFDHYRSIVLNDGKYDRSGWNWIRWVEYSITASFMTWTISQLSGVQDLALLTVLVLLNVIMQLFGGLGHELINRNWRLGGKQEVVWWPFGLGFLPFIGIWAIIFAAFVVQATANSPPAFVWVIIFGMFFLFLSFVVPILLHYTQWQAVFGVENIEYEIMFIVLSLLAKVALDWALVLGSIFV